MAATVYEYLLALVPYWWSLVIGILFGLDQLLEWMSPRYRQRLDQWLSVEWRRQLSLWGMVIAVFLSGLLAWKDEHNRVSEQRIEIGRQAQQLAANPSGEIARLTQANRQLEDKVATLEMERQEREAREWPDPTTMIAGSGIGVKIRAKEDEPAARALRQLFGEIGYDAEMLTDETQSGHVQVYIGKKPGVVE